MDRTLIIKRLKEVKNFQTDAQLAEFLGVSPATLCNWKARNTVDYDLIFDKYSPNELYYCILGSVNIPSTQNEKAENELLDSFRERIADQKEQIADLRDTNALLKELIKKGLAPMGNASGAVVGGSEIR